MVETESSLFEALTKIRQEVAALQKGLLVQDASQSPLDLGIAAVNPFAKPHGTMEWAANHFANLVSQIDMAEALARRSEIAASNPPSIDHTEELLRQRESRYRSLVEDQTDLICRYRPDFTLTFVNRAYSEIYNKSPEELIGHNFFKLMPAEDRQLSVAHIAKLSASNPIATSEHRSLLPDGSIRWMQWTDRVILDENHQIVEYQGVGRDITQRKLVEQAEQEQRRLAEALRDSLVALTTSLDVDTVMQHILEYAEHVVPYDAAGITQYADGMAHVAYSRGFSPEAQMALKEFYYSTDTPRDRDLIENGNPYLITDTKFSPGWIEIPATSWIRSSIGVPMLMQGNVIGLLTVDSAVPNQYSQTDVENLLSFADYAALALKNAYDKAKLEQTVNERTAELVYAKRRLEAILNNSTEGIVLAYLNRGIQQANSTFNTMFACSNDDYFGKPLISFVCDEYEALFESTLQSVLKTQQGKIIEVQVCRANDIRFDAEVGIGYIQDGDGEASFVCTIRDISKRKRIENDLAEERNRLRTVIDAIPDFIYIKDLEHRFVLANQAGAKGSELRAPDELLGKTDFDFLPHELAGKFRAEEDQLFLNQTTIVNREELVVEQDGRSWWAWSSKVPLTNIKGELIGLVGISRDISERKTAEEILFRSASELRELYNNAPCGYYSLDADGVFIRINDIALRWIGYSSEEVVNKLRLSDILTDESREFFNLCFPEFKRLGSVTDVELNLICKDGSVKTVLTNASVVNDENGNYVMSRSTLFDITPLKQVEKALRESEEKFRLMIESAPLATVITDQSGSIILANKQCKTLFGYAQDELIGQSIEILLPESMRHGHVGKRESFVNSNPAPTSVHLTKELTAIRKDGSICPVEIELSRIETQAGLLIMSFIMDISERKEQERQLRFNASLQESVTDAVIATDMSFTIQSWNKAAERIYGWGADEVIGRNVTDVCKPRSELDYPLQHFEHDLLKNGKWQREVVHQRKDGTELDVLTSINLLKDEHGQPIGTVGVNHDITARKQADEALQLKIEDELEFQIYLKALHDITIALTQVDQLDDFYRKTVEFGLERLGFERIALFLYDPETKLAIGTYGTDTNGTITDEHHILFVPGNEGSMMRALERSERFCFDENTSLHTALQPTGTGWNASAVLWNGTQSLGWLVADNLVQHRSTSKALLDTLALYAMTVGTLLARKQSDAAMRESESRYRLLAQNISDVIVRLNPEGEILYISPSSQRMLGYLPEEMVGRSGLEFVNANDLEEPLTRISDAAYGTTTIEALLFRFPHKDGRMLWLEATGQLITSPETGELVEFIASLRDASERKQAEEATRQALAKEKELGELKSRFVSMASHEFRTPLANIMATTETLSSYRQKMSDQQIEDRLNNVRGQVDHLKDIMDDVLQLSRIQAKRVEFNPQPLNLEALCREIVGEFQARPDIRNPLIFNAQNVPVTINLDRKLIRQIINNLISNAVKYSAGDKAVYIDLTCVDNMCNLKIVDQGIGIPEADLKHLFEPFHRATNVGTISGTGLGLIITREAVELHGGTISIQSRVECGTTITIEIPVASSKENERDQDTNN